MHGNSSGGLACFAVWLRTRASLGKRSRVAKKMFSEWSFNQVKSLSVTSSPPPHCYFQSFAKYLFWWLFRFSPKTILFSHEYKRARKYRTPAWIVHFCISYATRQHTARTLASSFTVWREKIINNPQTSRLSRRSRREKVHFPGSEAKSLL